MRHGLMLTGIGVPLSQMVETTQAAEAEGLDGVYCIEGYRSGFVPMTAIAAATSRITIGSYILNAYGRSPFLTGLSALDLDELSGGRLVVGVGPGNQHINRDWQGIEPERPAAKLREYVELLKQIVRAPGGGTVRFEGAIHRMNWTATNAPRRRDIPVWLAAIGPKMVQVAAAVADGVALGVLFSPEYIRDKIRPSIRRAAEVAGRDPSGIDVPMGGLIAVDDDLDRARATIKATICSFFHPLPHPYYDFMLREQGFSRVADLCAKLGPLGKVQEAVDQIDDAVADRLAFVGSPTQCARRLAAYEGLIDEVVHLNVGGAGAASLADAHRPVMAVKRAWAILAGAVGAA